jgi:hypothetical protein
MSLMVSLILQAIKPNLRSYIAPSITGMARPNDDIPISYHLRFNLSQLAQTLQLRLWKTTAAE